MADDQQSANQSEPTPWWSPFPAPKSTCSEVEPEEVLRLLENRATNEPQDFLLVDVRRTDWEGGTISSSINFPAQSLYQTRPIIHQLAKQAGIKRIIFYCGSSSGRGPRSSSWLQDYFDDVGEKDIESLVMKGGIKGWVRKYGGHMMDWYDEATWAEKKDC